MDLYRDLLFNFYFCYFSNIILIMTTIFSDIFQRNYILAWAGTLNLAGFAAAFILSFIDERTITGVNAWLKPMKFFLSVAIYLFTMAYILSYLPQNLKWLSWTITILMTLETTLISMQAARGVTSHFNETTAFNGLVFSVMGISIFINTLLCTYILVLYFTSDVHMSESLLWGIRMGLLIFILASLEGIAMVQNRSHTVGVPDGGKGLPFVNWSREGGDLRIAHFIGMHALQVLPIAGAFIKNKYAVIIISIIYFLISALLFIQAIKGRVFLG